MAEAERSLRAPRGTHDVLPPHSWRWRRVMGLAMDTFAAAGYAPVETPAFEHTEVFERGVGSTSEVVTKQMYTFTDGSGRSLTLRPEGTAPVMRAVLEHGLGRGPLPVKLAYAGAMFRRERPQKGRHRQFWQVGIEAIGSDEPVVDAEVVEIGVRVLFSAGVNARVLVNSIGHLDGSCRLGYVDRLRAFLDSHRDRLAPGDRARAQANPLRTFDSKEEQTRAALEDAPVVSDHLCDACRKHFDEVTGALSDLGVEHSVEPRLVRGLDYYTRTAFEFVAAGLGAHDAVGGGGRYDGLSELLGGPRLPGIGFALGVDRILLAAGESEAPARAEAFVVALGGVTARSALEIATALRRAGIAADLDLAGRAAKGQMREADRSGARWAVIVGSDELAAGEATVKDLARGGQERVPLAALQERLRR